MTDEVRSWIPAILYSVLGLPLALQDINRQSVSLPVLSGVFLAWTLSTLFFADGEVRLLAAIFVLLLGSLALALFPGRLGEADVVFMSGMALLLPFWSLLVGVALACVAALSSFLWMSLRAGPDSLREPIPFLPSLYWGGLTVIVGGIKL